MSRAPCRDCTDREIRCHSKCKEYAAYRKVLEGERALERAVTMSAAARAEACRDTADRVWRHRRK